MRGSGRGVRARVGSGGFTLLEMMLVVVIIGVLATIVVMNLGGAAGTTRRAITVSRLSQVKGALTQYFAVRGAYPATLDALTAGTNPLLEHKPRDGWDRGLWYMPGGTDAGRPYALWSAGEDGVAGTADDVDVWTMGEARGGGE